VDPIERVLNQLNRPCKVVRYRDAPQVHRVQLKPLHRLKSDGGRGELTRARHLELMARDIALGLGVDSVEIAVDEGKLWLLIPKKKPAIIPLSTADSKGKVPWILGCDIRGNGLSLDLASPSSPHVLVAGTTGSGKTVGLKAAITWLLLNRYVHFVLIDTKQELGMFANCPRVIVIHDARTAMKTLEECRRLTEERFRKGSDPDVAGRVIIVVDEFADLVFQYPEVENVVVRLSQKVRAAGYHLVIATQRPTVGVVTGLIKANMPVRVAYQCVSKTDSRVILDQNGAEKLLGCGDGLLMMSGKLTRFQGVYVDDAWIKERWPEPELKPQPEPQPKKKKTWLELYFPLTCTLAHVWGFRHVQPVYVGDKLSLADNRKSRARELDDPDPLYVAVEQIETHIYGYKSNLAETKVRRDIPQVG
jgi:DNA segregation ATPase FtsK/SpoIIIE-like protein